MSNYSFLIFPLIIYFILIRESIIDIKTLYVPDNITFSLFAVSTIYIIIQSLIKQSIEPLKNGLIGGGVAFIIPLTLSFLTYFIKKCFYRQNVNNKLNNNIDIKKSNSTAPKIKKISTFCIYSVILYLILQNYELKSSFIYITYCLFIFCIYLAKILSNKYKKINVVVYIIGIFMLYLVFLINHRNIYFIFLILIAFCLELLLNKVFKRFYKIPAKDDNEIEDDNEDDGIDGGIGGGDILIFSALGMIFGIKGFITIFLYSAICQLIVILSYYLLGYTDSMSGYAAFVPGITLATLLYFGNIDILGLKQIIFYLFEVL